MATKPIDPQMLESLRIRYGEVKNKSRLSDQIKQLKDLSKNVDNLLGAWKATSNEARDLTAWFSWHEGEMYSPYTAKGLTDDDGVPTEEIVEKMDRAVTALEPLASLLKEIVGIPKKVKGKERWVGGNFEDPGGYPGNPALRDLIESRIPYWEDREGSPVTFSHDGSQFEFLVQEFVKEIDQPAVDDVHEVLADVLRTRKLGQHGSEFLRLP